MQRSLLAVGAPLLTLLAAAALPSPAIAAARPSVPGLLRPDMPVDRDVYTLPYRVHRYPGAAVDPGDLAHLVEIDADAASSSCTVHASFDAGYTWTSSPVPLPDGWSVCKQQGNDGNTTPGRMAVAFGPDGAVDAVVRPTNQPGVTSSAAAYVLEASHDGGRTLRPQGFAFPTASGPETAGVSLSAYLAVDTTAGPNRGAIYVIATCQTCSSGPGVYISSSRDGGRSFSSGALVGTSAVNSAVDCCAQMAVGKNGELDVVAPFRPAPSVQTDCVPAASVSLSPGCAGLAVYRSTDAGLTWLPAELLYPSMEKSSGFSMAVDAGSGTVYAVLDDRHGDDDGLWVTSSSGPLSVATPTEVARAPAGTDFAFPAASSSGSRLDLAYYRIHRGSARIQKYNSSGQPTTIDDASTMACFDYAGAFGSYPGIGDSCPTDVFYTSTTDGHTFPLGAGVRVNSVTFDNLVGYEYGGDGNQVTQNGLAIVSTPEFARVFWTDSRNNTDQVDGNQDQYTACVSGGGSACAVPAGFSTSQQQPLQGIPGFEPLGPTAATRSPTTSKNASARVIREDVFDPRPTFPPPLPGRQLPAPAAIVRTVAGSDVLVPLYTVTIVLASLAVTVLVAIGLRKVYRWMV